MAYRIEELHDRLFTSLEEYHHSDKTLLYTLRTNNIDGKLEEGYWFLGDEGKVVVSFWNGINVYSNLPYIYLSIDTLGYIFLEIEIPLNDNSTEEFFSEILYELKLPEKEEGEFFDLYKYRLGPFELFEDVLFRFLTSTKSAIDEHYFGLDGGGELQKPNRQDIGFIPEETFSKSYRNAKKYRKHLQDSKEYDSSSGRNRNKPFYIKSFEVKNFMSIERAAIENLSEKTRWVFITGQNGSGKTVFLKSIAYCLSRNAISLGEGGSEYIFNLELHQNKSNEYNYSRDANHFIDKKSRKPMVRGFAAYGVYRLSIDTREHRTSYSSLSKKGSIDSLMKPSTPLIDFIRTLKDWGKNQTNYSLFQERESYIRSVMIKVAPGIKDVHFIRENYDLTAEFFVQFGDGQISSLNYEHLSSGTKSVLSLVSDISIRFYNQQPEIFDPSEFKGIVLIDEIDLHLHPKAQIELVQNLHSVFPGIQFIVTTHSPMPLLGAPKNSAVYTIGKNDVNMLQRLDKLMNISQMLPNTILTSPIFDLPSLIPAEQDDFRNIRTEDSWEKMLENDDVKSKIETLLKKLKK